MDSEELECESSHIIGQKDLLIPFENPKYFHIKRNYLNIPTGCFCSAQGYDEILKTNKSLECDTNKSDLEQYGIILRDTLTFDSSSVIVLYNDDYLTLLHTIGIWAMGVMKENPQDLDCCFIKWPNMNVDTASIDIHEVSTEIQTFMVIWGAHVIENISEFLRFTTENTMIVFVTQKGFKEIVRSRLESFKPNIRINEVSIADIDKRPVEPDENAKHQEKIKAVVQELLDLMLRYEALIYFYSPFNLDDQQKIDKIKAVLDINNTELGQLNDLHVKSDLAAITGRILWLKQPIVAKELLNDFINEDIISVSSLVMV